MNPLDQLMHAIVDLHILADRLARKSAPSHELVEAADAMRDTLGKPWEFNHGHSNKPPEECPVCQAFRAYDAARSRHASGAQPDSACDESGWLVEITGPKYWTGTPGCGNWTADSLAAMRFARRQDAEAACRHLAPSGAIPVEHAWVSHRPAGAQPSGAPSPASAQEFEVENDHATCLWCDAGPFTYDVGPGGWDEHWRTCEKSPRNKRKTSAPASAQSEVCEKCSGAGWVWGHELPTPEEKPTDTRYSCPACRVTNIDGTPPSSEKTGDASPASEVKACPECGHTAEHLSSWISPRKDIPERLRFTCFEEGCQCSRLAAPAPVPFGSLGNDVEETLDALLGFGRSERMVERAQLRNEIAGLLSRRAPAPSPASGESARTASKDASKELDELLAVFAKGDDDDEDCWTQPARRAQLYVASLRAEVERLEKRVTNLLSGTVESFEDGTLTILPHREMTTRMASALAGILDECEAPNYVQMILSRAGEPGEPRKRYVVTVQRPEGKTPHQLREDAEKERDALRAEVDRLRTEHARLIAVINDDGSLENIDDIVSIAEDAMHAYNVQNKLIEEVERLRAGDPVGYIYQRRDDPSNVVVRGVAEMRDDIDMYPESWKRIGPVFSASARVDVEHVVAEFHKNWCTLPLQATHRYADVDGCLRAALRAALAEKPSLDVEAVVREFNKLVMPHECWSPSESSFIDDSLRDALRTALGAKEGT